MYMPYINITLHYVTKGGMARLLSTIPKINCNTLTWTRTTVCAHNFYTDLQQRMISQCSQSHLQNNSTFTRPTGKKLSVSQKQYLISTVHCKPDAQCIALLSTSSTLSVAGVSVLFNTALATVDVGTLIDVGKAQMTGFSRNLAATSIGRRSCLSASRKLQHSANHLRQHFLHFLLN